MTEQSFTNDFILNGKISIQQPKKGYRVAIDPIILASFVQTKANQTVLDVGCGVGAIALILKYRNSSLKITAIDIDEKMCELCRNNSEKNNLELEVEHIGIEKMKRNRSGYDHIVTNPPFFEKRMSHISEKKMFANFETIELSEWIRCCLKLLKEKGTFSMIHNASRLGEIFTVISDKLGDISVIPIYPKNGSDAIRVIIRGTKGSRGHTKIKNGLILHCDNGKYTTEAQRILSGGHDVIGQ